MEAQDPEGNPMFPVRKIVDMRVEESGERMFRVEWKEIPGREWKEENDFLWLSEGNLYCSELKDKFLRRLEDPLMADSSSEYSWDETDEGDGVLKVLDERIVDGKTEFYVKWKDAGRKRWSKDKFDSWVTEINAQPLIDEFRAERARKEREKKEARKKRSSSSSARTKRREETPKDASKKKEKKKEKCVDGSDEDEAATHRVNRNKRIFSDSEDETVSNEPSSSTKSSRSKGNLRKKTEKEDSISSSSSRGSEGTKEKNGEEREESASLEVKPDLKSAMTGGSKNYKLTSQEKTREKNEKKAYKNKEKGLNSTVKRRKSPGPSYQPPVDSVPYEEEEEEQSLNVKKEEQTGSVFEGMDVSIGEREEESGIARAVKAEMGENNKDGEESMETEGNQRREEQVDEREDGDGESSEESEDDSGSDDSDDDTEYRVTCTKGEKSGYLQNLTGRIVSHDTMIVGGGAPAIYFRVVFRALGKSQWIREDVLIQQDPEGYEAYLRCLVERRRQKELDDADRRYREKFPVETAAAEAAAKKRAEEGKEEGLRE